MNEEQVVINKFVNDASDSLEIGTPAKGGAIKVYGNFNEVVAFKTKIANAIDVRNYANEKLGN